MMPDILGFTGGYRYLSNFHIEPDGTCVEVEYQMAKVPKLYHYMFRGVSPWTAKILGGQLPLIPEFNDDWRLETMLTLVRRKFHDHKGLRWKLYDTYPAYIEETNYRSDEFWGVCQGRGANMLGAILMQVRDEIRALVIDNRQERV